MTLVDCKAIFNLQMEIIEAPTLTDEQKLQMIRSSIKKTLGTKSESE